VRKPRPRSETAALPTSRRDFLRALAAVTGASAAATLTSADALAQQARDPRFLIVLCAGGGGSVLDGPLPIRASESASPTTLNTFEDARVVGFPGSPFRAVDQSANGMGPIPAPWSVEPSRFFAKRRKDLLVSTLTGTSVNHAIAQRRSITGNEAWKGRTLQELVAWQYGGEAAIPNVHLLAGTGFNDNGTDDSVPPWARRQIVTDPALWPLSLDGTRGQPGGLSAEVLALARKQRNEVFEPATRFDQVLGEAPRLVEWKDLRGTPQQRIEGADLITKLMVATTGRSLDAFGLEPSPALEPIREVFPRLGVDPLQAEAALAFLLLKYRVSVTVTLGANFGFVYESGAEPSEYGLPLNSVINPPLAFDFSHQGHRSGQAVVWNRLYSVIDGLITLLEREDFGDGTSFWDRTMIYVATEFGREKTRPENAADWGTGHHLDNGALTFSPLVRGDTLLGGVDPDTGLTYGYDPVTGAPEPGRKMSERDVFSGLVGALALDTAGSGLPDVPAVRRA
jgi:hypothetical protein